MKEKSKLKVLVVDDTADMLELMTIILNRHGFDVETAVSKKSLVNTLSFCKPDLIVLDLRLVCPQFN